MFKTQYASKFHFILMLVFDILQNSLQKILLLLTYFIPVPANTYLSKFDRWKRCEICSKLTIKTPQWHCWHRNGIFIVNFEQILNVFLVYPLLTLGMYLLGCLSLFQRIFLFCIFNSCGMILKTIEIKGNEDEVDVKRV